MMTHWFDPVDWSFNQLILSRVVQEFTALSLFLSSTAPPLGTLPALEIVARPDYPVAVGEEVHLNCSAPPIPMPANWSWLHLQNKKWTLVGSEKELTLTKPEESGVYRCQAVTHVSQMSQSQNYTVYIVSVQATG